MATPLISVKIFIYPGNVLVKQLYGSFYFQTYVSALLKSDPKFQADGMVSRKGSKGAGGAKIFTPRRSDATKSIFEKRGLCIDGFPYGGKSEGGPHSNGGSTYFSFIGCR